MREQVEIFERNVQDDLDYQDFSPNSKRVYNNIYNIDIYSIGNGETVIFDDSNSKRELVKVDGYLYEKKIKDDKILLTKFQGE